MSMFFFNFSGVTIVMDTEFKLISYNIEPNVEYGSVYQYGK